MHNQILKLPYFNPKKSNSKSGKRLASRFPNLLFEIHGSFSISAMNMKAVGLNVN